jgi:hypothetical protein
LLSRYKYNTNQPIQAPKINSADGWYHKIVSLISTYSLSRAIIYALGRFYTTRRIFRLSRYIRSRLVLSSKIIQPLTDLVSSPPLEDSINSLRELGWCSGLILSEIVVKELQNLMNYQKFTCASISNEITFKLQEREKFESNYNFPICHARSIEPFDAVIYQSIKNDKVLVNISASYFGYSPTNACIKLFASFPTNATIQERLAQKQSIFFHPDIDERMHSLSFFFYLSLIDDKSGGHVLIPGTHKGKKLKELFRSLNFSDDDIKKSYPSSKPVVIYGNPGEGFAEDSFIFHKSQIPSSQDRYVIQVCYW